MLAVGSHLYFVFIILHYSFLFYITIIIVGQLFPAFHYLLFALIGRKRQKYPSEYI